MKLFLSEHILQTALCLKLRTAVLVATSRFTDVHSRYARTSALHGGAGFLRFVFVFLAISFVASQSFSLSRFSGNAAASAAESQNTASSQNGNSSAGGKTSTGGVTLSPASASSPSDTPLHLGNPSRAVSNAKNETDYLLEKSTYALSYNNKTYNANWVAWHLSADDFGKANRDNFFYEDSSLPKNWYAVKYNDFRFSEYGFERGHLCPSADRTADAEMNTETFHMTNIVPQAPDNNQGVWNDLEMYARKLAREGKELYIFAGTYGVGGTSDKGTFDSIPLKNGRGKITVPAYTWKIIIVLPKGDNDISRITAKTETIAVMVPNVQGCGKNGSWQQYKVSIDDIENATGLDFLDLLDDKIEDAIEARK